MNKIYASALIAFLLLITLMPNTTSANNPTGVISVDPVIKEEQADGIKSYFNIVTEQDGYKETLEFTVRNKSKEPLKVKLYPVNALTSTTGVIDYRPENSTDHSRLTDDKHSFAKYATVLTEEVTVDPGQMKIVQMEVDIPDIKGNMLGGLAFQVIADTEVQTQGTSQFEIKHEVVNVIAVNINNEKDDKHKLEFGDVFLRPSPSYYNIVLPALLDSSSLILNAKVEYAVKDSKGKLLFREPDNTRFNFAPNSQVNVAFPWTSSKMVKGEEYTIKGQFVYDYKDEKMVAPFEKKFKLDETLGNNAGSFEETEVVSEFDWRWLLLGLIPLLLFLLLLPFLLKKRYVLYSNSEEADDTITNEEVDFELVMVFKKDRIIRDGKGFDYAHIYKKKGKSYKYIRTELVPKQQRK